MANLEEMMNAIGITAEMGLCFYRAILKAGATQEEAIRVTQAYIGAMIYGRGKQNDKKG